MQLLVPGPKRVGNRQGRHGMQAVNEHNAARLPLLLSTKLLPGMEAEEAQMLQAHAAAFKGQELAVQISELTVSPWRCQAVCALRLQDVSSYTSLYIWVAWDAVHDSA